MASIIELLYYLIQKLYVFEIWYFVYKLNKKMKLIISNLKFILNEGRGCFILIKIS